MPSLRQLSTRTRAGCGDWEELEPRRMLTLPPTDINGVLPFSFDQPYVNAFFRRTPNGAPLTSAFDGTTFTVQAFLDTGTSSIVLSQETWDAGSGIGLGIQESTYNGQTVTYSDVGVGGTQDFSVSEPLYTSVAPFPGDSTQLDNPATYETYYNQKYGPLRVQLTREDDPNIGPLDIFGMPVLQGKVMVFNPATPANAQTYIYNPGTPFNPATADTDPGIPLVNRHVKLSYADTSRFTEVTPSAAPGPVFADNPFIGPDPTQALSPNPKPDSTPPVSMSFGTHTSTGSFLFDTGAQGSFISQAEALKLGVHYNIDPNTNTDPNVFPVLLDANGNEIPNQFTTQVSGVGGTRNVSGFYMDSLTLPTVEGQPIRYVNAPVLVNDVTVADPVTGQTLTLDGDFGVNFISTSTEDGLNTVDAPFPWVTFDQPNGLLGLDVPGATALPPSIVNASFDDNLLPQTLTFNFSQDVTGVTASSLVIKNTATQAVVTPSSFTYDPTLHTATATFNTEIPDGRYTATLLASAITDTGATQHLDGNGDGTGGDNYVLPFTHLVGDANHDGVVNYADMVQILGSGKYNTGAPATWSDGDFNYDGKVDAADLNRMLTFGHYNQPPPPAAPAVVPQDSSAADAAATASAPPSSNSTPAAAADTTTAVQDSPIVSDTSSTSSAPAQEVSSVAATVASAPLQPISALTAPQAVPPTAEPEPAVPQAGTGSSSASALPSASSSASAPDQAPSLASAAPPQAGASASAGVAVATAAVPAVPVARDAAPACGGTSSATPPISSSTEGAAPTPVIASTPAVVTAPTEAPHARQSRRHRHHHSSAAAAIATTTPPTTALPPTNAQTDAPAGHRHKRVWDQ